MLTVTGVASWRVNSTVYTLGQLDNGALPGHSRTGTNILVNSPVNNTEYICVSQTNDGETSSDPSYIIIAGEYACSYVIIIINYINAYSTVLVHIYTLHLCMYLDYVYTLCSYLCK